MSDALFTTHSFSAQQGASLPPSGEKLFSREREIEERGGEENGGVLNAIKIINNCPRSPRNETNVAIHPDVKLETF